MSLSLSPCIISLQLIYLYTPFLPSDLSFTNIGVTSTHLMKGRNCEMTYCTVRMTQQTMWSGAVLYRDVDYGFENNTLAEELKISKII